jgi:hypothetical protein
MEPDMKTEEDEAFDEIARKQGHWGGGFMAKRQMAADKQEPPSEWAGIKAILDEYGLQAIDFVADFKAALAQPAQEPVAHLWECLGRWSAYLVENGKQADCAPPSWLVDAINKATTSPLPVQEPYDQTALELCNVCGWKTLIPDDGCLNCEREKPPQREWVGLTDEEIAQGNKESWVAEQAWQSAVWWAEAKLKEKNNGT